MNFALKISGKLFIYQWIMEIIRVLQYRKFPIKGPNSRDDENGSKAYTICLQGSSRLDTANSKVFFRTSSLFDSEK